MEEVSTIGLDLAKHVFQAHGASASGAVVFRKKLRRDQVLAFFAGQPRCRVAMEACASAHHWGRALGELGHEVRLIPPAYVKPFARRTTWPMRRPSAKPRSARLCASWP
jgi:transposase